MNGPYPPNQGALVTVTDRDVPEYDGMKRFCWIKFEKCDELLNTANEHYKGWNGTTIETGKMLDNQQPIVIRDELLLALRSFELTRYPFSAEWLEFVASGSPFSTLVERKTRNATSV